MSDWGWGGGRCWSSFYGKPLGRGYGRKGLERKNLRSRSEVHSSSEIGGFEIEKNGCRFDMLS